MEDTKAQILQRKEDTWQIKTSYKKDIELQQLEKKKIMQSANMS